MLDGLILFRKGDCLSEVHRDDVSRVVFKGGILGGACQFWGNPYLNSTTVLFDTNSTVKSNHLRIKAKKFCPEDDRLIQVPLHIRIQGVPETPLENRVASYHTWCPPFLPTFTGQYLQKKYSNRAVSHSNRTIALYLKTVHSCFSNMSKILS